MLQLMIGKDWTANTNALLQLIAEDVHNQKPGRILLVPELISHDMERRLSMVAGDTASRYAEVLTFSRLARRVAEHSKCGVEECLDNGGRVVVMAAAARQLHGQLKAYAALETKPEFLVQLLDAIDEFKRCCISPADLLYASKRSEGILAQKLEELSLLLEAYDALCERGKRDPRDQMSWVLDRLEEGSFAEENVFYVDGFPDFTRQHMSILQHMIKHSAKVIISLNCDAPSSKNLSFEKAGQTAAELINFAKKSEINIKVNVISSSGKVLEPVCEYLFQGGISLHPELASQLRLQRGDSVYQECQGIARDISQLVRNGARYRDIALVCTDMNTYRPVLSMVFRRNNIPVYLSGTEDILYSGAMTTVLTAIEAALDGFDQPSMIRYLRSAASPIDQKTCDLVENYAFIWGITGRRWLERWTLHPDGLSDSWTEWTHQRLQRLEQTRCTIIEPLRRLQSGLKSAIRLADQVLAVYQFLEDIHLAKRLSKMAADLDKRNDNRSAQILNQLWDILVNALEQMHDVLGETHWDTEAFLRLFTLLLGQYDVGTIPTVLDAVTVGPVSAMRCQQTKHLFVLGASEGLLPGYGGSTGVLTDQERVALRKLDVPLTGGALEGIQAEFAEVYGVFCGAQETVSVSCSSVQPSYIYRRLRDLVGKEYQIGELLGSAETDAVDAAALLVEKNAAQEAAALGIDHHFQSILKKKDHQLGLVSRQNIEKLYGTHLTLSASQVDRQAECRFSYFLKYGLRVKERKEAKVDPAEFGTYVHWVLEKTVEDVIGRGGFHSVDLEQTMELASNYSKQYAQEHFGQLESQRMEYLFNRNVQELDMVVQELWTELSDADFQPVHVELGFGKDDEMPGIGISTPDMQAELLGYVDRIDRYSLNGINYFRVVDYKTGKKDFDYCDVFNGVGLQMLLYLFALEQGGETVLGENLIPAGVQYFPARVPFVSLDGAQEDAEDERRKLWKRRGLLLLDELSLKAMDHDEKLSRLCCTRKKDGTLSGDLATRDQLKQLRRYVFAVLEKMVQEISSGVVDPNPYTRGSAHSACAFCPYGAVCHKDSVSGRRNYKTMTSERFWQEIEKEVSGNG